MKKKSIVWVSSWKRACGIADYAEELFAALGQESQAEYDFELCPINEGESFRTRERILGELTARRPDLVHFQHEYSFFGGKNPPRYWFPAAVQELREKLPETRLVATAHTVVPSRYRYPLTGRGRQIPARWAANTFLLPMLRPYWGKKTWGALDGAIVHSDHLVPEVEDSGCPRISLIPLFVPKGNAPAHSQVEKGTLLVFGFLTPEKGQDVVVQAMRELPQDTRLILAGGLRRDLDRGYETQVRKTIRENGLESRVEITGFVPAGKIEEYYRKAELIVLPLRESSGSASLTQAFSRGSAVLASDLPLNRGIERRMPGVLELFRSEDPADCARKIRELLASPERRAKLSSLAREYASLYSPARVARMHLDFYREVLAEPIAQTTARHSPRS